MRDGNADPGKVTHYYAVVFELPMRDGNNPRQKRKDGDADGF